MDVAADIGSVIAGCRLDAVIGRGGMGVVYVGEQLRLERTVAVKVISPEHSGDAIMRRRFRQEWQAAASLEHPNVVPIHEAGEHDDVLYIVMRYVRGPDLRVILGREGPLPPPRAARIVCQLASALDAAHARGLIHRDVKPANALVEKVDDREHAYLTDFGVTKLADARSGLTQGSRWVGSVDNVGPEQVHDQDIDRHADVYSLGCLAYQLLSGAPPYARPSDAAKLFAHVNAPPPTLAGIEPAALNKVLAGALAKEPDERYGSAGDLASALSDAVCGLPQHRRAPPRSIAHSDEAPTRAGQPRPVTSPRRGHSATSSPRSASVESVTTGAVLPADAPGRRRRTVIVGCVLAGALALTELVLGVLATTGGAGSGTRKHAAAPPAEKAKAPARRPRETHVPPAVHYRAAGYTASFPPGWQVVRDDAPRSGFSETKAEAPNARDFVLIDHALGGAVDPQTKAVEVRDAVSTSTPAYRELGFGPTLVGGRQAWRWTFDQTLNGRTERRVDYFFNVGGDGFAVLGGGRPGKVLRTAGTVARSIHTR